MHPSSCGRCHTILLAADRTDIPSVPSDRHFWLSISSPVIHFGLYIVQCYGSSLVVDFIADACIILASGIFEALFLAGKILVQKVHLCVGQQNIIIRLARTWATS